MTESGGKSKWVRQVVFALIAFLLVTLTPGYFIYRYLTFDGRVASSHFEPLAPPQQDTAQVDAERLILQHLNTPEAYKAEADKFQNEAQFHTGTEKLTDQFFQGMYLVGAGNYEEAINLLSMVINGDHPYYKEAAEWYLMLAYVGNHDHESANEMIARILATPNHDYAESAALVLKKL